MGKDLNVATLLDTYAGMLTERQRDMVGYYYCDDLSLAEIAENEGITRQAVRDMICRAVKQLEEMEERLGFVEKTEQTVAAVSLIRETAIKDDSDAMHSIVTLCDTVLKQE